MNAITKGSIGAGVVLCCLMLLLACPGLADGAGPSSRSMKQRSTVWTCKIAKQFACAADACQEREPKLEISIDFGKNVYMRCISSLCDTFKFRSEQWDDYCVVNIDRKGGAYFIGLNDGSEFTESVSQGIWTLSAFGSCVPRRK